MTNSALPWVCFMVGYGIVHIVKTAKWSLLWHSAIFWKPEKFSKPFWELVFNCLVFNSDQNIFPHNEYRCGELHAQLVEPSTSLTFNALFGSRDKVWAEMLLTGTEFIMDSQMGSKFWDGVDEQVPWIKWGHQFTVIGSLALYFLSSNSVKLHLLSLSEKKIPKHIYIGENKQYSHIQIRRFCSPEQV